MSLIELYNQNKPEICINCEYDGGGHCITRYQWDTVSYSETEWICPRCDTSVIITSETENKFYCTECGFAYPCQI